MIWRSGRLLVGVAVVAAGGWYAHTRWSAVEVEFHRLSWARVVGSAAALVCAKLLLTLNALHAMRKVRPSSGVGEAFRTYHLAQLGKYVPGGAWHLVGRVALLRDHGMTARASGIALGIEHTWLLLGALSVAAACLLADTSSRVHLALLAGRVPASLWPCAGLAVVIASWFAHRHLRQVLLVTPSPRVLASVCAAYSMLGISFFALGVPASSFSISEALGWVGAFALAYVAGLAVPVAPAGVGVREAVLVVLLTHRTGAAGVLVAAAVHRFVYVAVEGALALLAWFFARRQASGPSGVVSAVAARFRRRLVARWSSADRQLLLLLALSAVVAGFKVWSLVRQPVHWDEFLYLSRVFERARGDLDRNVQVMYATAFAWLTRLPCGEIEIIRAARLTLYPVSVVGSGGLVYLAARPLLGAHGAVLSMLCCFCIPEFLEHQSAFRADSLALPLALAAAVASQRRCRWTAGIAGCALGLAVLVTAKSIFYLPSVLTLLWSANDGERRGGVARRILLFAAATAATCGIGYGLVSYGHQVVRNDVSFGGRALVMAFTRATASRTLGTLFLSARKNPVLWLLLIVGAARAAAHARRRDGRATAALAFLLPLASLLFYRNVFPYYLGFILPPAMVLCGYAVPSRGGRLARWSGPVAVALAALAIAVQGYRLHRHANPAQAQIVNAVHKLYPTPVPYISGRSTISSFPSVGFFMSSWGMEWYHDAGRPLFRDIVVSKKPLFLLSDVPDLDMEHPQGSGLLREDVAVLSDNYLKLWGPIFVPGKVMHLSPHEPRTFEVLIGGSYALRAPQVVSIDGQPLAPGDRLPLTAGTHVAELAGAPADIRLMIIPTALRGGLSDPPGPLFK